MNYLFVKNGLQAVSDKPLCLHYGIPRTGSSTIRHAIRRYSNLVGQRFEALDLDKIDQEHIFNNCDYLFIERPYAVHLITDRSVQYITTVRPPSDHIYSLFIWKSNHEKQFHGSFDEFVHLLPKSTNIMCRWLKNLNEKQVTNSMKENHLFNPINEGKSFFDDIPDDELFEQAKHAVDSLVSIAAPLEYLSEFCFALAGLYQWPLVPLNERVNHSVKSIENVEMKQLQPKSREKVLAATQADEKLYQYVKKKFKREYPYLFNEYKDRVHLHRQNSQNIATTAITEQGFKLVGEDVIHEPGGRRTGPKGVKIFNHHKLFLAQTEDFHDSRF